MISPSAPIKRKVMGVIMLTSGTVVALTIAAFMIFELVTHRENLVRDISTLAQVVGDNSTAAVAFRVEEDARDVLASLRREPQVVAAALYDATGSIFVTYPDPKSPAVPARPEPPGHRFTDDGFLLVFVPLVQNELRVGTVCLKADLRLFYRRILFYSTLSVLIMALSLLVALMLSSRLQRRISEPILTLASAARSVSERGDYSVRAVKTSDDEIGLLTGAFNQMLTRIQEQTVALQESEARLRLALEASRIGTWDWHVQSGRLFWDDYNCMLFGIQPDNFRRTYDEFAARVHPDDFPSVEQAIKDTFAEKGEFSFEFRTVWPDGSVHDLFVRGRALYDADGKPMRMAGVTIDITQRKLSEKASRHLAAIVETSDDAIISKDLNGTITSWNKGAERLFGFDAEEAVGKPITLVIPEELHDEEWKVLGIVSRGERVILSETLRRRKDGTTVNVLLTISPIQDAQARIIGASSIVRDITERKRAEIELQENRTRLSGIISSAMDAIISVDASERITIFNDAAEKMFHCSASDAIGKPLDVFIPQRFRKLHHEHIREFGRTGVTARAMANLRPVWGLRTTGEEFPIEASISQMESAGQKIYTVILRDVTERVKAQESLESQARTLREQAQMLDLANVMARDFQDRVILWNTGMENMYGWSRGEAMGRPSHEFLQTWYPQPLEQIKEILMRDGHWEGELIHKRKDGKAVIVASEWVLHKDPEGHPVAILEVNTDITARKEAEQQMLRMNAELEQRVQERTSELIAANHELEAFTYSVAHDLRAPLRHIDAFTKILFEDFADNIPAEARRYLENIRKGSQNMSHLVDDLLNLARVGRQELKRELTPLNSVVDEVVADLKRETRDRHVEWRIGDLPAAESDPGLMKQVFTNLLSNAVKYTRPRKEAFIEVGLHRQDGEPVIYVRDNGVGFNMKYADKLFGVFQRLHRADEFEGTGVGLAIVDRIVRRHGGRIWAESEIDKGAAFYFTLEGLGRNANRN